MKSILGLVAVFIVGFQAWAGSWQVRDFQGTSYQIYLPTKKRPNSKSPLMITLHGCAQKTDDLVKFGNWEAAANRFSTVIVAPTVPNGGVIFGCWEYYGAYHTDQNHYHGHVFALLNHLLKDSKLRIDAKRVYVSGLSSGAGEALILSCLRPDLIAGAGLNSSPAVPSEAKDTSRPPITGSEMARFCKDIAGPYADRFKTQTLSVITADQDAIVNVAHSHVIVDAFHEIYSLKKQQILDLSKLPGSHKEGSGSLFLNSAGKPQLSLIINKGIGHNWAAGSGQTATGSYITQSSINYPMYLLDFLEKSNPR